MYEVGGRPPLVEPSPDLDLRLSGTLGGRTSWPEQVSATNPPQQPGPLVKAYPERDWEGHHPIPVSLLWIHLTGSQELPSVPTRPVVSLPRVCGPCAFFWGAPRVVLDSLSGAGSLSLPGVLARALHHSMPGIPGPPLPRSQALSSTQLREHRWLLSLTTITNEVRSTVNFFFIR